MAANALESGWQAMLRCVNVLLFHDRSLRSSAPKVRRLLCASSSPSKPPTLRTVSMAKRKPQRKAGTRQRGSRAKYPTRRRPKAIFPPAPSWPRLLRASEDSGACRTADDVVLGEGDWSFQPLLWQRARDVVVWARALPDNRAGLFSPGPPEWQIASEKQASEVEALAGPIRLLGALVRYPEVVHAADLRAACMAVSEWADSSHLPETALAFAEVAGLADPWCSHAAAHAGQLCAQYATDDRAEVWYERGIKIGRRTKDWEWYIRSNLRLGLLRYEQGKFRASRRCYGRAHSTALWAGFPAFAGQAHHAMLLIEIADGTYRGGDRHARLALDLYPVHYVRLPHLAHDYAVLLTCWGCDSDALAILDEVLPLIALPHERIAVLGTIAKAAAGVADIARHRAALEDVLLLASMSDRNAAGALALSGEGALRLGEWERAEHLARYALKVGARRREREPQRRANLVLQGVAERKAAAGCTPRPDQDRVAETTALFLARLVELRQASPTDAGALSRARTELTKFTIAGR